MTDRDQHDSLGPDESWEPTWPSSSLPEDPRYWTTLERRILDDAALPLHRYAEVSAGESEGDVPALHWYGEVSRHAPWLVAASLIAGLLLWARLPLPDASTTRQWMQRSLTQDHLAASLATIEAPSPVAVMMQLEPATGEAGTHADPPGELHQETSETRP